MHKLTAKFHIVTPMFVSGAQPTSAELRIPSIKGVLRFWWRAIAWQRLGGDLAAIQAEEATLFGSTESVSTLKMNLVPGRIPTRSNGVIHLGFAPTNGGGNGCDRPGARYLGYGLMGAFGKKTGVLERPCLEHGNSFSVQFLSLRPFPKSFVDALELMGLLGGVGSRVRRGYGSIALESLAVEPAQEEIHFSRPSKLAHYQTRLNQLLSLSETGTTNLPSFSAFSSHSRLDFLCSADDPIEILDIIGRQMQRYRSWGKTERGNSVNGIPSEKNFEKDHDWIRKISRPEGFYPRRAIFGLPYDKVKPHDSGRRSSPLLIHVHKIGDKFVGMTTVLRSLFLEEKTDDNGNHVEIQAGTSQVPMNPEWNLLDEFLDGSCSTGDQAGDKYFPHRETWLGGPSTL